MKSFLRFAVAALLTAMASHSSFAATVLTQNFDADPVNYTATFGFGSANDRYYQLSNAPGIILNPGITGASGNYVATQNINEPPFAYTDVAPALLTFDPVPFSGNQSFQLSGSFAGLPNAESNNFMRGFIDSDNNGTYETKIFDFSGTAAGSSAYIDNTGGVTRTLTPAFQNFTFNVPSPTSGVFKLQIQSWNDTDSSNEATGYDNIVVTSAPAVPVFGTATVPAATQFSEPAVAAQNYVRGTTAPGTEIGFTTTGSFGGGVTDFAGDKAFVAKGQAASAVFTSEQIDLRGVGAAVAGIDLRSFDSGASNLFDAGDFLRVYAEVSTDGLNFTRITLFDGAGITPVTNEKNDPLDNLENGGAFTHFQTNIDASIETMRWVIEGFANSANENLVWDNLTVALAGGASNLTAAVTATPANGATVAAGAAIQVTNATVTAPDTRDSATLSAPVVTGAGFGQTGMPGGTLAAGQSQTATVTFAQAPGMLNGPAYGALAFNVTAPAGATGVGSYSYTLKATVAGNTGDGSSVIPANASYAGLSGTSNRTVGSVATILAGTNTAGTSSTVAMAWRDRTAAETPHNGAHPLLPDFASGLTSDVVNLTGTDNQLFALQMTYNTADLQAPEAYDQSIGHLFLVSPNAQGNWVNSIELNHVGGGVQNTTNPAFLNVNSSFAAFLTANGGTLTSAMLGAWGVDLTNHSVWAVLNHNSDFASVPEPSSIVLGSFGLLGLVYGAIRRRRMA